MKISTLRNCCLVSSMLTAYYISSYGNRTRDLWRRRQDRYHYASRSSTVAVYFFSTGVQNKARNVTRNTYSIPDRVFPLLNRSRPQFETWGLERVILIVRSAPKIRNDLVRLMCHLGWLVAKALLARVKLQRIASCLRSLSPTDSLDFIRYSPNTERMQSISIWVIFHIRPHCSCVFSPRRSFCLS